MRPARQSVLPANLKSHTETPQGQSESEKLETVGGCSPLAPPENIPRLGVWLNVEPTFCVDRSASTSTAHSDLPPLSG